MGALVFAACGSDPTATPAPTNTPLSAATATPTLVPGEPTPTPQPATPTPAAATATPVPERDMAAYFDNKTITLEVGFSPGGGYDAFSRIFGKFAPKHFPGNPRFLIRNLPGAGGERVLKAIYDEYPDGTHIAVTHSRFFKRELLGTDVPYLDLDKTIFLGSPSAVSTSTAIYVFKDFAMTWEEATEKGLVTGATAVGDTGGLAGAFVQALGGPVKVVYGYGGTSEIAAAFDRREISGSSRGNYSSAASLFPEWVENQSIVPIVQYGAPPEDDPMFVEYMAQLGVEMPPNIKDVWQATDAQWSVYDATETVNDMTSRTFLLKEGTPADIVAVMKQAFKATVEDPGFIAGNQALGRTAGYASGEEILAGLQAGKAVLDADPSLVSLFAQLAGADE
jgi:tripartite-type tricarboxylate transporter receptor subunit TctC